jgi:hypothetical protein
LTFHAEKLRLALDKNCAAKYNILRSFFKAISVDSLGRVFFQGPLQAVIEKHYKLQDCAENTRADCKKPEQPKGESYDS